MNRQRFLSELLKLLVFMTDEDRALVEERIGAMFDMAGPDDEDVIVDLLGSPTRTAIRLSRGYEPGNIPELPEMDEWLGQSTEAEDETAVEANGAEEFADEESWDNLPAFELPDVEADGFEPVPTETGEPAEEEPVPTEDPRPTPDDTSDGAAAEGEGEETYVGGTLRYIEPHLVAHDVPDYGDFPAELTPVQDLPPRYMPLWAGVLLFIPAILILGVPLAAAALVLFVLLLVPGALLTAAAWFIFVGGLWCVAYIADAVMLFGASFIALGLGLIALWLGLWIGVNTVKLYVRGIRALWRVCFGRKEASRCA